jgi:hypothetical protein
MKAIMIYELENKTISWQSYGNMGKSLAKNYKVF